jgi:hypothetical protein
MTILTIATLFAHRQGFFHLASLRNTLHRLFYEQEGGEHLPDLEETMSDDDIALQVALQEEFNTTQNEHEEGESSHPSRSGQ